MLEQNKTQEIGQFDEQPYHKFLWIKNKETTQFIEDLYWQNCIDDVHPYSSGLQLSEKYNKQKEIIWTYMEENCVLNE